MCGVTQPFSIDVHGTVLNREDKFTFTILTVRNKEYLIICTVCIALNLRLHNHVIEVLFFIYHLYLIQRTRHLIYP